MERGMAKARSIQLADPRADRPRTEALATIAIGAASLGLVLALGVAKALPEHPLREADETTVNALSAVTVTASARSALPPPPSAAPKRSSPTAAKAAPPAPAAAAARPKVAAVTQPPPASEPKLQPTSLAVAAKPAAAAPASAERAAAPDVSARDKAREDETPAKRKLPKRSFEMGVVAYTRCDGLERPGARYPCPRDRKLEDEVWQTLERLSQCTAADPGRGAAEVRLTLRRAAAPGVDLKPATSGPSLNLRAVSKCAGPKLAQTRSRLRSPHAVVSFRFGLK
jgi:hypothetical protein